MPYKSRDTQRAYKREWTRMQRAGECGTPGGTLLPVEFRLQTAYDILMLLGDQVRAVRDDESLGVLERARCIGFLASVALRAVEAADMTARVEAIEAAMKVRK